jgi:hypothetical protein
MVTHNGKVSRSQARTGAQLDYVTGYGLYSDPRHDWRFIDQYQGTRRIWAKKLYLMKCDPTIAFLRQLFISGVLSAGWSVDADDDVPAEIIDFMTEEAEAIHFGLIRQAGLGCLDWGWAPFEKLYHRRKDGLMGIKACKPLLQSVTTIEVEEETGEFVGFRQNGVELGMDRALLFNFDVEGTNHYGSPPMKALEMAYDRGERVHVSADRYNNRIAANHWVIYYPPGTTEVDGSMMDNYDLARNIMERLLAMGSAVLPATISTKMDEWNEQGGTSEFEWKIENLGGADSGNPGYDAQHRYYDVLKARGLGFPERSVFEGQHGTKAEAAEHIGLASIVHEDRSQELTKVSSDDLLVPLVCYNFGCEWADKIALVSNPINDTVKAFYADLYDKLMGNPEIQLTEYDQMDHNQLRERLGVPVINQDGPEGKRQQSLFDDLEGDDELDADAAIADMETNLE